MNKKFPLIFFTLYCFAVFPARGDNCTGRFINPLSDICWSCIMPISIGEMRIGKGGAIKQRDTKNPSSPLCSCVKNNIPVPGVSIGFWEPVRLAEVTRSAYCFVGLGGVRIGPDSPKLNASFTKRYSERAHHSYYHLHYYVYPVIYWLELITDLACLEKATFDVAYLSELDVSWNDEKLQLIMNPEVFLFANPVAQAACALDCKSAAVNFANDKMFWCAGCLGNAYPLSGHNADYVGGVQNSSLLTYRILAKMHRAGLARETSTSDGSYNGKLCRKPLCLNVKKSQYKLQLVYPKASSGSAACVPLGISDLIYSPGMEYPGGGQDWVYLIWRKKNCCML